jgi:hypothetical protein
MRTDEPIERKSSSTEAALPEGAAWRGAQVASTLGFLWLVALLATARTTTAAWIWLLLAALWLVPGGWMIWVSWRTRRSR